MRDLPAMPKVPDYREAVAAARRSTTQRFLQAAHTGQETRRISSEMRDLRIRNGFPELIEDALARRVPR